MSATASDSTSATSSATSAQTAAEKKVVQDYFNTTGFDRWRRIYGEGSDVSKVQRDIRAGHQRTVDLILYWLKSENLVGHTVCDAGCGVGSLSIPLAQQGAQVYASDLSDKMTQEGRDRAIALGLSPENPVFTACDLESLDGEYDTVACVDVLIHYPDADLDRMIGHLANLAKKRLILSFAPKNPYYTLMKRVGEFFPGPSKTTRAYLHRERDAIAILRRCGFEVNRTEFIASQFYFSRSIEALRV
jgi:magnesium-protoporphyrin O-methyltransferase